LAAIHALLLLATLGFAYQTWTRDVTGPIAPGSVLIWDADVEDIVGITYESEAQNVWIERREDEAGTYHWATVTIRARETGTAQAAGDTAASTSTKEPPRVMSFVVGQEGDILLDEVASLRALRDLGTASEEQESEYGLADATAKIVVQMDGGSSELEVGGKAWGGNDRYVRDSETGRVYVLPGTFVGRLEAAEYQLPERRLHLFADS